MNVNAPQRSSDPEKYQKYSNILCLFTSSRSGSSRTKNASVATENGRNAQIFMPFSSVGITSSNIFDDTCDCQMKEDYFSLFKNVAVSSWSENISNNIEYRSGGVML